MSTNESASEHLDNALSAFLAGDQTEVAIQEFEEAIRLGLPKDKEAFARVVLGNEYSKLAARNTSSGDSPTGRPEWVRAEAEIVEGLRIDREESINQFTEPIKRALLVRFDIIADLGGSVKSRQSLQLGIDHLNSMLNHTAYLASQPLLNTLFRLGHLYDELGEAEKAIDVWEQLCAADPVDYVDASGDEATLRSHARENIEAARSSSSAPAQPFLSKGCLIRFFPMD